jgi:NADH-quinone oxidoreductase subunit N
MVGGTGPTVHAGLDLTAAISALTMLYPALMLLRARSVRHAAGYLMVAQVGFMLAGVLSISQGSDHRAGIVALLVYAISAGVTTVALFGMIGILEAAGFKDGPLALRGLGHRTGATAFGLALVLASMGGLPPAAIFVARMLTLESAVVAGYAWLAVVAVVSTVLLGVVCIRMIASMYEDSGAERLSTATAPLRARVVVGGCTVAAVAFTAVIQP